MNIISYHKGNNGDPLPAIQCYIIFGKSRENISNSELEPACLSCLPALYLFVGSPTTHNNNPTMHLLNLEKQASSSLVCPCITEILILTLFCRPALHQQPWQY